jgi:hypothetical protein
MVLTITPVLAAGPKGRVQWEKVTGTTEPRFGIVPYRELLGMTPAVPLTPKQSQVLSVVEDMAGARDLTRLPKYLAVLKTREYDHLQYIMHRGEKQTMRHRYHTPFTDLFLNLADTPQQQTELVRRLGETVRNPVNREARTNAITALTDLYFFALRPGGAAFAPAREHAFGAALRQQQALLELFDTLLSDDKVALETRRLLKNEIICGHCDLVRKDWPVVKPEPVGEILYHVNSQLSPLTNKALPDYPTPVVSIPVAVSDTLKAAIRDGNISKIRETMNLPVMKQLVPDWDRAFGRNKYQHNDQDYTLGTHLLKVYKATRRSPYYQGLSAEEKFRVSTGALFHDISKRSGPKNYRDNGRIMFDIHHPWRSAETVLQILPALHYTPEQIQDIHVIVQRHQNLGGFANPRVETTPERLMEIARRLQTVSRVNMLLALTEGDVRCVKRDIPGRTWYTPLAKDRIKTYSDKVIALLTP